MRLLDAWIEDADGDRLTNVEHGGPIRLRVELEATARQPGAGGGLHRRQRRRRRRLRVRRPSRADDGSSRLAAGERVEVSAEIENLLVPGRYFVHCGDQPRRRRRRRPLRPQRGRLRRLRRRTPLARDRLTCRTRSRPTIESGRADERPPQREPRAARGARALGARRRRAALLRPALADLGDRVQAHLLRHRARLPVVADPAADAVRGPALRLHQGLQSRQRRSRALPGDAAARASSSSPSSRNRAPTRSPRSSARRGSSARPSSRGW